MDRTGGDSTAPRRERTYVQPGAIRPHRGRRTARRAPDRIPPGIWHDGVGRTPAVRQHPDEHPDPAHRPPRFAAALSTDPSRERAEERVVADLAEGLRGARPDLLAVFVSHHHGGAIEGLGPRLAERTGARVLIGCTGESIIGGGREVEQRARARRLGRRTCRPPRCGRCT